MCIHDLCLEQKQGNHHNFSYENDHFHSRVKSPYIAWVCYRNGLMWYSWLVADLPAPEVRKYFSSTANLRVKLNLHISINIARLIASFRFKS